MAGETATLEFKEWVDLSDRESALKFVKEIVALANAGGGRIEVGVTDEGSAAHRSAVYVDPATLTDKVDAFISPDHLELVVEVSEGSGRRYAVIVPEVAAPPLVMAKDGTFGSGTKQATIFRKGDVFVRTGTKAQRATRQHFTDWADAVRLRERGLIMERMTFVAKLPADATLQAVASDEELDEPSTLLSRSSRAYQRNPEKLLTSNELLVLLQSIDRLSPSDEEWSVLLQSALRKRTTLWFWLTKWQPTSAQIEGVLESAIEGKDRDKSDAGRAIVDVAATFLDQDGFGRIASALQKSTYKHFRDAVDAGKDREPYVQRVRERVQKANDDVRGIDAIIAEASTCCETALGEGASRSLNLQLARLGFEWFGKTE